jgi:hypothetical protein
MKMETKENQNEYVDNILSFYLSVFPLLHGFNIPAKCSALPISTASLRFDRVKLLQSQSTISVARYESSLKHFFFKKTKLLRNSHLSLTLRP